VNETIDTDLKRAYDEYGYVIARNAIDADLAGEMAEHVHWLARKHPDVPPERFGHNMLAHDPFMWRLAGDDRLLDVAAEFIGNDIALFAAHYIAKPPHTGKAVQWHQDGSYWPLEPMEVTTLWVAGTASNRDNGCMRVIPGTQHAKLLKKSELVELDREQYVLGVGMRADEIDDSAAVDLELEAGDVSIHNPTIIHGSNANTSETWRIGLTLRYVPTTTLVRKERHENLLLRGDAAPGVDNVYAERPRFVEDEHMPFRGSDRWNQSG